VDAFGEYDHSNRESEWDKEARHSICSYEKRESYKQRTCSSSFQQKQEVLAR